ncbi:MAG: hypothetical protein A2010_02695 [Nitrospirae bacterium GWD2_57_9]|nr:MAG: hypothetical protein A2010_02695 [Nitrospirae bacterium GWD2_57_9]
MTPVRSCCEEFCSTAAALSCPVVPGARVAFAGVTWIACGGEKVSRVDPVTLPDVAVIRVEPVLEAAELTTPSAFTVARSGSPELHITFCVSFLALLFEKTPIASNSRDDPGAMLGVDGDIAIETRSPESVAGGGDMVSTLQPGKKEVKSKNRKAGITKGIEFFMVLVSAVWNWKYSFLIVARTAGPVRFMLSRRRPGRHTLRFAQKETGIYTGE